MKSLYQDLNLTARPHWMIWMPKLHPCLQGTSTSIACLKPKD